MMDSAVNGATITLTSDVVEAVTAPVGKDLTLDLGGYVWSANGGTPLTIPGSNLTIRNGTIKTVNNPCIMIGEVNGAKQSEVVLEDTLKLVNERGTCVYLASKAHLDTSADMTATKAAYCIRGNHAEGYSDNSCLVRAGTLSATDESSNRSVAIYWPQDGDLAVMGGTISGDTGIEVRAGTLAISGGRIMSTLDTYGYLANNSGPTTWGTAVAICQHVTKLPIRAVITGGILEGPMAFIEENPQANSAASIDLVNIIISGGTFKGDVSSADVAEFVEGGTFSSALNSNYIRLNVLHTRNDDGTYTYYLRPSLSTSDVRYNLTVDGTISSTVQGHLMGAMDRTGSDLPTREVPVNAVIYSSIDRKYYRWTGREWASEDMDIADDTLQAGSTRPIQNDAVVKMRDALQTAIDNCYTEAEVNNLLNSKQDAVTGAAQTIVKNKLALGKVLVSNQAGDVVASDLDSAKLTYLSEVNLNVQDQIDTINTELAKKASAQDLTDHITSANSAFATRYTKTEVDNLLLNKQAKLTAGDNISIDGNNRISAVVPDGVTVDSVMSSTSTNPVQNKIVKSYIDSQDTSKYNTLNSRIDSVNTDLSNKIDKKQVAGDYVTTESLNTKLGAYATMDSVNNLLSSVYAFKGVCTSAELDSKERVVGNVWNLSDAREANGKTYAAGTSWVYEYVDASNNGWEPLGSNFSIDLSGLQEANQVFTGTVQTWVESTDSSYARRGTITRAGVTSSDVATVIFSMSDASSGKLASYCETDTDKVYVFAREDVVDLSATVIIQKG